MNFINPLKRQRLYLNFPEAPEEAHNAYGISARLGITGRAFSVLKNEKLQKFQTAQGVQTVCININSLANYIYCYSKSKHLSEESFLEKLKKKYNKSHDVKNLSFHCYKYFKKEIAKEVSSLFSEEPITLEEFISKVEQFEPRVLQNTYKGFFYRVRREEKTIGYILGSQHEANSENGKLNPKIVTSALKTYFVATEVEAHYADNYKMEDAESNLTREDFLELYQRYIDHYEKMEITLDSLDEMQLGTDVREIVTPQMTRRFGVETIFLKIFSKYGLKKHKDTIGLEEKGSKLSQAHDLCFFVQPKAFDYCVNEKIISPETYEKLLKVDCFLREPDLNTIFKEGNKEILKNRAVWDLKVDPFGEEYTFARSEEQTEKSLELLEEATHQRRVTIIAGAAHFYGKNGIIPSLRASLGEDYDIQRI